MAEFGEMLAELRQDRHMTQEQLANKIFVTIGTISNYENGVHFPDVEKLIKLADFFNVTTDYLLGRASSDLSPDVFDEPFVGKKTIGSFLNDIKGLSDERRQALFVIMRDMQINTAVERYNKRENI